MLQVLDAADRPLAPAEPLRVRLACAEPKVCRFRFDTGTSAPGALVVDWDLAELLDKLPVQKQDSGGLDRRARSAAPRRRPHPGLAARLRGEPRAEPLPVPLAPRPGSSRRAAAAPATSWASKGRS